MQSFPKNIRSILASQDTASSLARISDRFNLSERQRRLQSKILAKLFLKEVAIRDLPRILRINLNLSNDGAENLARTLNQEFLANFKEFFREKKRRASKPPSFSPQEKETKTSPLKLGVGGLREWFDNLVARLGLTLSPLQRSRLESTILTYLREVRDEFETEEALQRSLERGGIGLSRELASRIILNLKEVFPEAERGKYKIEYPLYRPPKVVEKREPRETQEKVEREKREVPPKLDTILGTERRVSPKKRVPEEISLEKKQGPLVSDIVEKPEISPPQTPPREKIAIQNLRTVSELASLAPEDFKGDNPEKLVQTLVEKVKSLVGKNDLEKFKAVEAWRSSSLYKLYIEIGEESIAQGKTITEVAKMRLAQNKPYLKEEEFNALADLSREFQY